MNYFKTVAAMVFLATGLFAASPAFAQLYVGGSGYGSGTGSYYGTQNYLTPSYYGTSGISYPYSNYNQNYNYQNYNQNQNTGYYDYYCQWYSYYCNRGTLSATPTSGQAPLDVYFTSNQGGTITFGDGTSGTLQPTPGCAGCSTQFDAHHTYTSAGTFTARGYGASSQSIGSVTVTVTGGSQSGSFTASPQSGAAPLYVSFTYALPNFSPSTGTYSIDFGDGQSGTLYQTCYASAAGGCFFRTSHTYIQTGTYSAVVRGTNGQIVGNATVTVTGGYSGGISITGLDAPAQLSVNQSGTWSVHVNHSSPYLSYSVVWGDEQSYLYAYPATPAAQAVASSGTFTHSYSQAGTYTPQFTVTDSYGQSAHTSATVTVSGGGCTQNCGVPFSATPTSGTAPLAVTFTVGVDASSYNYTINFGDGTNGTLYPSCIATGWQCMANGTASHTYTSAGTYTAQLLNSSQCITAGCNVVGTVTIVVSPAVNPNNYWYCAYYPNLCYQY